MPDNLFWSEDEWDLHMEDIKNTQSQKVKNHMKHAFGQDSYEDWERVYSRKNTGKKQKKVRIREIYQ